MISSILIFASAILSIAWSLPFILGQLFGLQFYIVSEDKVLKLLKKMKKISSLTRNEDPDGWIVGYPFIGYIYNSSDHHDSKRELYLFTTKKYFAEKSKEIEQINDPLVKTDNPININIFERYGSYSDLYYIRRTFNLDYFEPREEQKNIIDKIITSFEKKRNNVTILYGEKGTGKSMIPLLLAKELSKKYSPEEDNLIRFCDTFKPTEPGDSFVTVYNRTSPSKNSPLIVVIEEFDTIVYGIHHNKIIPHKNCPILIKDKPSWNQFFDRFDRKYYPWTILIMTTNMHPDYINSMDPSYIREGRVDSIYNVVGDK
jgi:hypothetical protein